MMNSFDKIIADKLSYDGYPVDEQMWANVASALPGAKPAMHNPTRVTGSWIGGILATAALVTFFGALPNAEDIHPVASIASSIEHPVDTELDVPMNAENSNPVKHLPQENHAIELMSSTLKQTKDQDVNGTAAISSTSPNKDKQKTSKPASHITPSDVEESEDPLSIQAVGIQCPGSEVRFSTEGVESPQWSVDGVVVLEGTSVSHAFETAGL